jgi:hypothetical protein
LILDSQLRFGTDFFSNNGTFLLNARMTYSYKLSDLVDVTGRYAIFRTNSANQSAFDVQVLNLSLELKNTVIIPALNFPASLSLLIDFDWSTTADTPGWTRQVNFNLGLELI